MSGSPKRGGDLREACIAEALAIIEQGGLERLSMRDVARRLGVSHQAPYKHFATRDHILAEIVRRAFDEFAHALDARAASDDPAEDFLAMGVAYVSFALSRPLHYRLMFGGALPDPQRHPDMMRSARHSFSLLRRGLERVLASRGAEINSAGLDLEALFVWSSLHGVVSLLRTDALETLDVSPETRAGLASHALARIGSAMGIAPPAAAHLNPSRSDT
jgi:AcrR family transcriptional regulator